MANEEPTPVRMAVTCRTTADPENGIAENCPENGITYLVPMYPNATEPVWRAMCGQCGRMITDIVPAETVGL